MCGNLIFLTAVDQRNMLCAKNIQRFKRYVWKEKKVNVSECIESLQKDTATNCKKAIKKDGWKYNFLNSGTRVCQKPS